MKTEITKYSKRVTRSIEEFFGGLEVEQVDLDTLVEVGFSRRQIQGAVAEETLCEGVYGYWMPGGPDPGAMLVMFGAMAGRFVEAEEVL